MTSLFLIFLGSTDYANHSDEFGGERSEVRPPFFGNNADGGFVSALSAVLARAQRQSVPMPTLARTLALLFRADRFERAVFRRALSH